MDLIRLSNRLAAIAAFVPQGASVVDVGTDHGHIPIFLAQRGGAARIVASDLHEGPLQSARSSAGEYGVGDKIEFIRADGLAFDGVNGIDAVIISGVGGELIASIIDRAGWLKGQETLLILQPQSKIESLCSYLTGNGYPITDALLVRDSGKLYGVMTARAHRDSARGADGILALLSVLYDKRDPLLPEFLDRMMSREMRAARGRRLSKEHVESSDSDFPEKIRHMREEIKKW